MRARPWVIQFTSFISLVLYEELLTISLTSLHIYLSFEPYSALALITETVICYYYPYRYAMDIFTAQVQVFVWATIEPPSPPSLSEWLYINQSLTTFYEFGFDTCTSEPHVDVRVMAVDGKNKGMCLTMIPQRFLEVCIPKLHFIYQWLFFRFYDSQVLRDTWLSGSLIQWLWLGRVA